MPGTKVLLVVEDDDAAYELFLYAMQDVGAEFRLFRMCNGVEALEFLRQAGSQANAPRPDLIVLDLNMPKMGGIELLELMREDHTMRTVSVIVFTSSQSPDEASRCRALGARSFVTKPHDYDQLLTAVKFMCAAA